MPVTLRVTSTPRQKDQAPLPIYKNWLPLDHQQNCTQQKTRSLFSPKTETQHNESALYEKRVRTELLKIQTPPTVVMAKPLTIRPITSLKIKNSHVTITRDSKRYKYIKSTIQTALI